MRTVVILAAGLVILLMLFAVPAVVALPVRRKFT
jgi:hypothetical protein